MPLRLQHLEQTPFQLCIQPLDKPKEFARGNILLTLSAQGQDAIADDDFELLLFCLPVAYIPSADANGDGAIGDG